MVNWAPNVIGKCNFLMAFPNREHKIDQNLNEPFSEVDFGFGLMADYGANVDLIKGKFLYLRESQLDVTTLSLCAGTKETD